MVVADDVAEPRPEVVEIGRHRREGGDEVHVRERKQQRHHGHEGDQVHGTEPPYGVHHAVRHQALAELDVKDAAWMHQPQDLPGALAVEKQHAVDLQAASGGAGAAAGEGGEDHRHRRQRRPRAVVGGREAGRGGEGNRLEQAVAEGALRRARVEKQHAGDDDRDQRQSADVNPRLAVLEVAADAAPGKHGEVQREADSRERHEDDRDAFDGRAVEVAEARVMGGKTADGHRGEGMADGVEGVHASEPVGDAAGGGEAQVDEPQRLGRLGDARRELGVLDRPRRLGAIELHSADAEHRQHRHRQHDDAHAAEPLQPLSIEEHRARQVVEASDHCGAGGGEAGERLERGIGERRRDLRCQVQGKGAGQSQSEVEQHGDEKALAAAQLSAAASAYPEHDTDGQGNGKGDQERCAGLFPVHQRHRRRHEQGEAEQHEQPAADPQNRPEADGGDAH